MKNKKEQIINLLKRGERIPTKTIARSIKSNYPRALTLLTELKREGKVKSFKEMRGVSWSLK